MASGGLVSKNMETSLKVKGTGITPRTDSPETSSSRPSTSSTKMAPGDAYNLLQSVVGMNRALEGQIDALRLRMEVESRHYAAEKQTTSQENQQKMLKKEEEIEGLHSSLGDREERIQVLATKGREKDGIIQEKNKELSDLRQLVKQTEDYAGKLYKRVGKLREDRKSFEYDSAYHEQKNELVMLRSELHELKDKCAILENELDRAKIIFAQQHLKLQQYENDQSLVTKKLKEEMDKASKAMRQEVERMREVMNQNYEEMCNIREQNKEMHNDVRDIKDLIIGSRTPRNGDDNTSQSMIREQTTSNINMSSYLMSSPSPDKFRPSPNPQQRNVELQRQKLLRPHPIPGVGSQSSSRVSRSTSFATGSKSTSISTGLPSITFGHTEKARWQSSTMQAEQNASHQLGRTVEKRSLKK